MSCEACKDSGVCCCVLPPSRTFPDDNYTVLPYPAPPTLHPHRCPICNGSGVVPGGFYGDVFNTGAPAPETCRTCGGKGVLWNV